MVSSVCAAPAGASVLGIEIATPPGVHARRDAPFEQLLALAARLHASGKQLRARGVGRRTPVASTAQQESQHAPANASVQDQTILHSDDTLAPDDQPNSA